MFRSLVASSIILVSLIPSAALAQQSAGAASPAVTLSAPRNANQFDFLVGQFELTVTPKVSGLAARLHGAPKLVGIWKGWRSLDGFGIEDELRIVDGSGNPNVLLRSTRIYDTPQSKWSQMGLDVYRARFTPSTAEMVGREMHVRSTGRDAEGNEYVQRVRFYDITPTGFKYQSDRSTDGERTWESALLRIEARRVSATAPR